MQNRARLPNELLVCARLGFTWNKVKANGADAHDAKGVPVEIKASELRLVRHTSTTTMNKVVRKRQCANFVYTWHRHEGESDAAWQERELAAVRDTRHVWAIVDPVDAILVRCWVLDGVRVAGAMAASLDRHHTPLANKNRWTKNFRGQWCTTCASLHLPNTMLGGKHTEGRCRQDKSFPCPVPQ